LGLCSNPAIRIYLELVAKLTFQIAVRDDGTSQ
jgi:hypothetical protein